MTAALSLPWAKVEVGMHVELGGRVWSVDKLKAKGKLVKVTVSSTAGTFTRELKAKDSVPIARPKTRTSGAPAKMPKKGPLHDASGAQLRWAKPGDATATKPPEKPRGGDWETPKGKAEKVIARVMPGATLVGATPDESGGWYVPPIGPDTIAAHLFLMHDLAPDAMSHEAMLKAHNDQHERALVAPFSALHVNHWHTKQRPSA